MSAFAGANKAAKMAQPRKGKAKLQHACNLMLSEFPSSIGLNSPTSTFSKAIARAGSLWLIQALRNRDEKTVLRIVRKPSTKPSRNIVNIGLFFATLGTVFVSGYLQSLNILGAVMFTVAIMAMLGSHEMGHKLFADRHAVELGGGTQTRCGDHLPTFYSRPPAYSHFRSRYSAKIFL